MWFHLNIIFQSTQLKQLDPPFSHQISDMCAPGRSDIFILRFSRMPGIPCTPPWEHTLRI